MTIFRLGQSGHMLRGQSQITDIRIHISPCVFAFLGRIISIRTFIRQFHQGSSFFSGAFMHSASFRSSWNRRTVRVIATSWPINT